MKIVLILVATSAHAAAWAHAGPGSHASAFRPPPFSLARLLLASRDPDKPGATARAVREALRAGKYPWYDPDSGKVRPMLSRKPGWTRILRDQIEKLTELFKRVFESIGEFLARIFPRRRGGLTASGEALMTALLWIALLGLLVALYRLWRLRTNRASSGLSQLALAGQATLLAEMAGSDPHVNVDPWAEALRRRGAGDLAGALVYLFVHQLVSLAEIGMIRLAPGVTGRQYVAGLKNAELYDRLAATLVLFEEVYYGHRKPSVPAFEAAWARAIAFRRDVLGKRDER
jgi:hypothetical protein